MKRWLLRICELLLLGAVVNVAAAWGIALARGGDTKTYARSWDVGTTTRDANAPLHAKNIKWLTSMGHEWKHPNERVWYRITIVESKVRGLEQTAYYEFREVMPNSKIMRNVQIIHPFGIELRIGWPAPALADDLWEDHTGGSHHIGRWVHRRGMIIDTKRDRLALPLRPIWPGFAINTVFYAVILWLLFAGPLVVRRWRRIRRGLCPKCAYDLRGSANETCPECGAAVQEEGVKT